MKRIVLRALLATAVAMCTIVAAAVPARATVVYGWGSVVIAVETGGKNYSNHTQWVGNISVQVGSGRNCGVFEAWTQGFYARTTACGGAFWYISRWVGSGNYVCGAFTDFSGRYAREITCIGIRV